ncbi:hypothetical protein EX30DRAFT_351953 [Ascodesmis nigricans]|uniref:Uncharacterized protein n=1 Tax=Ascodesmis nigricans TaxID=341454 RepID=A0A4S2MKG0_9PEZI|nr:hypothetical protein EX30DRAFT_351953 [Ascodesmis nigricans]
MAGVTVGAKILHLARHDGRLKVAACTMGLIYWVLDVLQVVALWSIPEYLPPYTRFIMAGTVLNLGGQTQNGVIRRAPGLHCLTTSGSSSTSLNTAPTPRSQLLSQRLTNPGLVLFLKRFCRLRKRTRVFETLLREWGSFWNGKRIYARRGRKLDSVLYLETALTGRAGRPKEKATNSSGCGGWLREHCDGVHLFTYYSPQPPLLIIQLLFTTFRSYQECISIVSHFLIFKSPSAASMIAAPSLSPSVSSGPSSTLLRA